MFPINILYAEGHNFYDYGNHFFIELLKLSLSIIEKHIKTISAFLYEIYLNCEYYSLPEISHRYNLTFC